MKLTAGALGSGVAVGLAATVAFGTAVAYAAPYTRQAVLVVSDPNPFPNQIDGVQGFDYHSTELVALDGHSAVIHFGDFMTDAAGHFVTQIRIPEEWRCSRHTLVGTGASGAPDDIASAVLNVRGCPGEEDHRHHHPMPGGGFFVDDDEEDDD